MMGRRRPYTKVGIRRVPCSRCGEPSVFQWQVCADSRQFRGVCQVCDVLLNDTVMRFMRIPGRARKMAVYRAKVALNV